MRRVKIHKLKFTNQKELLRQCFGLALVRGIYSKEYADFLLKLNLDGLVDEARKLKNLYAR